SQQDLTSNIDGGSFDDVVFIHADGSIIVKNITAGVAASDYISLTSPQPGWKAVGTGDVNNDGRADVMIWSGAHDSTQFVSLVGDSLRIYKHATNFLETGRTPIDVVDIGGDGFADLVLHDPATGSFSWQSTQYGKAGYDKAGVNLGSDWTYRGA